MKRCPECRRDYYDDTLLYCLDDGTALLEGPASHEGKTAILNEGKTAILPGIAAKSVSKRKWVWIAAPVFIIATMSAVWFLTYSSGSSLPSGNGPSAVAYDNYLRAKVLVASENQEDVNSATKLLEKTVAETPDFAAGWALLARAYNVQAFYYASADERKRLNLDAEVAVERALGIDPNLAEAHFSRGLLLWNHSKRFPHELAVQSYKRSLALDPKLDEAHHQLGVIYFHLGLFDKAQAEIDKTLEINPGNTFARFRYGVIAMYRGRYVDAYDVFKSTPLEKNPSLHAFQSATALFKLGRTAEAETLIEKYLRENPKDEGGVGTSVRAMILASSGRVKEAEQAIAKADEIGREFGHFHHTAYNIAAASAILGKQEDAIRYLQLAADDGFPCYPLFANDESFKSLRSNSRFIVLLANMKQQWDRYNAVL
jgi:tetratricopeptide (TPR) repeat protein